LCKGWALLRFGAWLNLDLLKTHRRKGQAKKIEGATGV